MVFRVHASSLNRSSGRQDLGSLPDLSTVRRLPVVSPVPRGEVMLMCQQKREELQMILEREQQRRRRTIVLRLGDFKVRNSLFDVDSDTSRQLALQWSEVHFQEDQKYEVFPKI